MIRGRVTALLTSCKGPLRLQRFISQHEYSKTLLTKNLVQRNAASGSLLRCVVFDSLGQVSTVSSELKKTELIGNHHLLPRDLRKIDKGYDDIVPSLLVRQTSILVNVLHVKALIQADSVTLFSYGSTDTHTHLLLVKDMANRLKAGTDGVELPYEIRALEAILISVYSNLTSEMKVHSTVVQGILAELETDLNLNKLRYLLVQSKKLKQFHQKSVLIRDLFDELLQQDDQLAELYLTDKRKGTPRHEQDHQEVELLLESYYKHLDEIVQTVDSLLRNMKTTEEIINIVLDSNRNQIMILGLRFSIGLMSFGGLLYVAALYGMNLENFIEEDDHWFYMVSVASLILSLAIFKYSLKKLNKLQRVTLVGDDLRGAASNLNQLEKLKHRNC